MINFLKSIGLLKISLGFLVGLLCGAAPGVIVYKQTIKEYDKRFELFSTMASQSVITASELRAENEKLRTRTVERVNADGSSEKVTETDSNRSASSDSSSTSTLQLQHTIDVLRKEHAKEITTVKRQGKQYSFGLGLNQSGDKYIMFSYPVWSKLNLFGHMSEKWEYGIGLGVTF